MPKRKLPPPPDAIQVPDVREGPEWEEFCAAHPLHQAVCGKASASVTEARVNAIIDWFHKGAAYRTVVRRGSAEWGLVGRQVEKLVALADQEMKRALLADRHEYLARMITRIDGMVEEAAADRQYSAAAGLVSIIGRWLSMDPSTNRRI